jgi:superkiller protein 8
MASTTRDGKIVVWNILAEDTPKIQEYETGSGGSGSFGMCVDLSRDGRYTASGHRNGTVYVFNNETGRLSYSLAGGLAYRAKIFQANPWQASPSACAR